MIIVNEINTIIDILSSADNKSKMNESQEQSINTDEIMDGIHKKIESIIVN
jgi:hypothetical protein